MTSTDLGLKVELAVSEVELVLNFSIETLSIDVATVTESENYNLSINEASKSTNGFWFKTQFAGF